jgi:hypothetical protein
MTIKRKDFVDAGLTNEGIKTGFKIVEHIEKAAEQIKKDNPDISPWDLERFLVRCVTATVLNQEDVVKWNRQWSKKKI